jgi:hypothetical protein
MTRDPVLAATTLSPSDGYRVSRTFRVEGGLHYIKGNSSPHFTLTYTAHRKGFPEQCYSGGAGHDEILRRFPRFADLADLHLSDINGAPMHAVENAAYFAGISTYPDARNVETLARHLRIAPEAAAELIRQLDTFETKEAAKAHLVMFIDTQRPRWKAEAESCIAKHNLRVFGDEWPNS